LPLGDHSTEDVDDCIVEGVVLGDVKAIVVDECVAEGVAGDCVGLPLGDHSTEDVDDCIVEGVVLVDVKARVVDECVAEGVAVFWHVVVSQLFKLQQAEQMILGSDLFPIKAGPIHAVLFLHPRR